MNESVMSRSSMVISIMAFFMLEVVWVLPHTIAARNIILAIGLISSVIYLWSDRKNIFINSTIFPLAFLFSLFIWVVVHCLFFSLDFVGELKEIKSLWVRSFAGIIFAIALGVIVKKSFPSWIIFLFALTIVPVINISTYLYHSFLNGSLLLPAEFVRNFLFVKIEAAFFGAIATSVFLSMSLKYLSKKQSVKLVLVEVIFFSGLILFALSSLISSSKNGVAISLGLIFIYIFNLTYLGATSKFSKKKYFIRAAALVVFAFAILNIHKSSSSPGWSSLLSDIKISAQINQFEHWKNPGKFGYPINENGQTVVSNTYERMAWAVAGWQLIKEEPLGYGSINNSFKGMLNYQKIEHNVPGQTHSGWTDFALAFGIPGLLIIVFTQLVIIFMGLKSKNEWGMVGAWICMALLPLGVIAEISYKQYFEATLFFIAFAAVMVIEKKE
jgi:hypothetical protein